MHHQGRVSIVSRKKGDECGDSREKERKVGAIEKGEKKRMSILYRKNASFEEGRKMNEGERKGGEGQERKCRSRAPRTPDEGKKREKGASLSLSMLRGR